VKASKGALLTSPEHSPSVPSPPSLPKGFYYMSHPLISSHFHAEVIVYGCSCIWSYSVKWCRCHCSGIWHHVDWYIGISVSEEYASG
jgi:hypothetical protein